MHELGGREPILRQNRPQVRVMAKIRMPVAVGIGDLGNHRNQRVVRPAAKPEADGVKDMTQHTRLRQKLYPRHARDVMCRQHIAHPSSPAPLPRRAAMVAVLQAGQPRTIAGEQRGRGQHLGLRIAKHIVHRIAKTVLHRALAAMKGLTADMIDARRHSAANGAARAVCIRSTTSTALASPSS